MSEERPNFGEALLQAGTISEDQLRAAREKQKDSTLSLGQILVREGMIAESVRIQMLARLYGFKLFALPQEKIEKEVAGLIPRPFAETQRVYPVRREGKSRLVVAMEDPSDEMMIEAIRHQSGLEVEPRIATARDLEALFRHGEQAAAMRHKEAGAPPGSPVPEPPKKMGGLKAKLARWGYPVLAIAPLPAVVVLIWLNDSFQRMLLENVTMFDLGIYVGLGWGLWAILLYEVVGLLFGKDE